MPTKIQNHERKGICQCFDSAIFFAKMQSKFRGKLITVSMDTWKDLIFQTLLQVIVKITVEEKVINSF